MSTRPHGHRPLAARVRPTWRACLPGWGVLRRYDRRWLRGDVLAGVTVAAYAIPQVMAYAQIAGLAPATGLVAIIAAALAYVLFGSSSVLSVGPESTCALMTAAALAAVGTPTPQERASLAAAFALAVGILSVVGWFGGLGFLADLLSRPVLVGYMAGVAALMVLSQVERLTGIPAGGETILAQVASAVANAGRVHWPTLALAGALLVFLLLAARLAPRWPNPLFAVLLGAAAVALLHLDRIGVRTVGTIPERLPWPELPHVDPGQVATMLVPALGIAAVAYSDNVLTARAFADKSVGRVDDNQEFLALGAANLASGLFHGLPVSSSGSRTAIGASLGARTQVGAVVTVATVVLAVLAFGRILAAFPRAALGALVVYAAVRLVEVAELRRIARFRRSELVLALATTVAVVLLGALGGILFAVGLSVLDLLRRVARPHDGILGYVTGLAGMHDIEDYPEARQVPGLVVYRYDSPLFFANAEDFRSRATQAVDEAPDPVEWLVLNAEANTEIDITSIDSLSALVHDLHARGVVVALARVKQELRDDLRTGGVLNLVGEDHIFPTLPTAVTGYLDWHKATHGRPHPIRE